jgi:uncharacterized SAM-binding protein YcdF (DUF218 family)
LLAGLGFFAKDILRWMGSLLVKDGPPVSADLIIVLAGDYTGGRILKSAELANRGYAPVVLVSNGDSEYGHLESDMATAFAVQHGYRQDLFVAEHWPANSTMDEARYAAAEFRKRGAHKVLIVTNSWHTARAGRIFRRTAPDLQFYLVGVDNWDWHHGDWWIDRQGRKRFGLEAIKTIADYLRI